MALNLDGAIKFYQDMAESTNVSDQKMFYVQVGKWLREYKKLKLAYGTIDNKEDLRCSVCGSVDIYEAALRTTGTFNGFVGIEYFDDGDMPKHVIAKNARCCRRCGNIMPYVRADDDE